MTDRLFRDLVPEFLEHHRIRSQDQKTMRLRLRVLNRYFGDVPLERIGRQEIETMIAGRLAEGMARSTINRARAALSGVFAWAIERGDFAGPNPVRHVRKFREDPGRTRYLTPAEAERLVIAAAPHIRPIILTALYTGGRLQEILRLCFSDVDFTAQVVTFRGENTKSGRTRQLPLHPVLAAALSEIRKGGPNDRIFVYNGRPTRTVRTAFERAKTRARLGHDVVFHTLRHTFASLFMQNGGDLYRLQHFLGHSTIALTQRYSHLSADYLAAGLQFIGPRRDLKGEVRQA